MKRLLIYLGLLATLLAMPYHAKADTWAYYLYGDINADNNGWNKDNAKADAYKFGETSNDSDHPSWTKTFTGEQLDPNKDGKAYFKIIRVKDGTQDMQLGPDNANDVELTINGGETVLTSNNAKSFYITGVSQTAEYTIKYVSSSRSGGTISVTGLAPEITPHDYYWVSPQVTNNQKLPYFKLVPSRNRWRNGGDGKISSKYYTFTIQDEFIKQFNGSDMSDNTQIQWYIVRDDGKVFYRPESELSVDYTPNSYGTLDSHVSFKNYWGSEGYMTTDANRSGSFSFSKGSAKAYTFILNAENGNVFFNYTTESGATDKDYYLIGNFTSAKGEVNIPIGDTSHKMTKWYYKGEEVTTDPVADADSIVYKVNVAKPAEGWGDLYIDINPSGNTDWNQVIRPLISLGNNLDGRALHGGLVVNNSNQSLNPETSDDYTSYTFSFNATTFTYRLEFHTSLYLVGPGVSATKEKKGSWVISDPSTSDPRIRLTPTQEKGHYRNRVYFTKGGQFRFIRNTDESATPNYKYTWYENTNKPLWESAASDGEYYPDNETQFRNYMVYENGTGPEPTEGDQSMTFDLPTGWYYVNFYPNADTPYYTIEHSMELRDFNEVYYRSATGTAEQRNVQGRNGYNFLRVWSDHIAWNKPDDIDVFVVSAFGHNAETHETTATLTKLNVNYIPANTGVILGCKLSKDNLTSGLVYKNAATLAYNNNENVNYYNTLTAELTPYSVPSTSYTAGESKLIPLYEETELKRFSNEDVTVTGETYANYLFGFYRRKKYVQNYTGDDKIFDLGFWLTTGEGKTYANSAFLQLTKAQAEDLGVGTAYNNIGSASKAFAPAFMLLFDESDDNAITGISDITTAKGNSVASQGWYTLQGVRTPKPTQRGIYIYNGKKVVVND